MEIMNGKIISTSMKGDFKVETAKLKFNVNYENWFTSNALAFFEEKNYKINSKSIWQNDFSLYKSDQEIGKITFNWKGNAILNIYKNQYILRFKGLLNRRFELEDNEGALLMVIIPGIKWSNVNYEYLFKFHDVKFNQDILFEILFASTYAANISTSYYLNA